MNRITQRISDSDIVSEISIEPASAVHKQRPLWPRPAFPFHPAALDFGRGYYRRLNSRSVVGTFPETVIPISSPCASRRFEMPAFFFRLVGWPAFIILGQLILLVGAWGFFAFVQRRQFVSLSEDKAELVTDNSHRVTLVFTLISTFLATWSSFLFSWGVRQWISIRLHHGGMSLGEFTTSVKISSLSLVLQHRQLTWSVVSIALLILTGVQTSGWSTLLTPSPISIPSTMTGTELDLSSPMLRQMQSSGALDYCVFQSNAIPSFSVGRTESGYAAAKDAMAFPATLTMMDETFNVETAGILPLFFSDTNTTLFFNGTTVIPTTLKPTIDQLPHSLSSNFTMTQQGFSTDIDCEFLNSTNPASLTTDTVKDWNSGAQDGTITFSQLTAGSDCTVPANTNLSSMSAYTSGEQANYILMVGCQAGENYTLIFQSSGTYDFLKTMVCTLTPQITTVDVSYSDSDPFFATINTNTRDGGVTEVEGGPAGLAAITTIANMVSSSQGITSNIIGDELASLLQESEGDGFEDDDVLGFMQIYIDTVAEYSGSVLRACLSAQNEVFASGVPSNMTITSNGILLTQTVGWQHTSFETFIVLIPGTVIAVLTIIIVLLAVEERSKNFGNFNPTDPMHLLSAAASGDLHDVFIGKRMGSAENTRIFMESSPGRRPALIMQDV
ncbi:hypothetical protein MSAN_02370100 [Mycena sanguinolenta]|uniref:Uncharacterized protein n=1 Tax=Mycena sanguinolenta TaxID=230812 RepID=A0A8H6X5F7_9AGAR|nr:hypothetical protein MSAN_02370100 [Mycena sanguinolenta]